MWSRNTLELRGDELRVLHRVVLMAVGDMYTMHSGHVQGYLAHKNRPSTLRPPQGPTVRTWAPSAHTQGSHSTRQSCLTESRFAKVNSRTNPSTEKNHQ